MLISSCYNVAYFEIITIEYGNFTTHSEFYPEQFQNNIKDGCIEFYGGLDSYVNLEFDPQTLTIKSTYMEMVENKEAISPIKRKNKRLSN